VAGVTRACACAARERSHARRRALWCCSVPREPRPATVHICTRGLRDAVWPGASAAQQRRVELGVLVWEQFAASLAGRLRESPVPDPAASLAPDRLTSAPGVPQCTQCSGAYRAGCSTASAECPGRRTCCRTCGPPSKAQHSMPRPTSSDRGRLSESRRRASPPRSAPHEAAPSSFCLRSAGTESAHTARWQPGVASSGGAHRHGPAMDTLCTSRLGLLCGVQVCACQAASHPGMGRLLLLARWLQERAGAHAPVTARYRDLTCAGAVCTDC